MQLHSELDTDDVGFIHGSGWVTKFSDLAGYVGSVPCKISNNYATGSGAAPNTWFLEPTEIYNPNSINIGSAVFAQLAA